MLRRNGKLINLLHWYISFENIHEIISYKQIFFSHGTHSHFRRQNVGPIPPKKTSRSGPVSLCHSFKILLRLKTRTRKGVFLALNRVDYKIEFLSLLLGGGFRDSLADIAEELCPSSSETPVPLPFFIRSPNQVCILCTSFTEYQPFCKSQ